MLNIYMKNCGTVYFWLVNCELQSGALFLTACRCMLTKIVHKDKIVKGILIDLCWKGLMTSNVVTELYLCQYCLMTKRRVM